ncbi:hypothetical protein BDZ85DRAFT_266175 [Elsinoe ampelina]|uniref:Uncharacterized protein n=1 Tax=Elsinoe ampelina TaxID=302913 RepID=A0A6A6G5Y6_9PEZI|nr:hypothetical protein BDZ85DRAFT_266175 [Elsinoe ampelina]
MNDHCSFSHVPGSHGTHDGGYKVCLPPPLDLLLLIRPVLPKDIGRGGGIALVPLQATISAIMAFDARDLKPGQYQHNVDKQWQSIKAIYDANMGSDGVLTPRGALLIIEGNRNTVRRMVSDLAMYSAINSATPNKTTRDKVADIIMVANKAHDIMHNLRKNHFELTREMGIMVEDEYLTLPISRQPFDEPGSLRFENIRPAPLTHQRLSRMPAGDYDRPGAQKTVIRRWLDRDVPAISLSGEQDLQPCTGAKMHGPDRSASITPAPGAFGQDAGVRGQDAVRSIEFTHSSSLPPPRPRETLGQAVPDSSYNHAKAALERSIRSSPHQAGLPRPPPKSSRLEEPTEPIDHSVPSPLSSDSLPPPGRPRLQTPPGYHKHKQFLLPPPGYHKDNQDLLPPPGLRKNRPRSPELQALPPPTKMRPPPPLGLEPPMYARKEQSPLTAPPLRKRSQASPNRGNIPQAPPKYPYVPECDPIDTVDTYHEPPRKKKRPNSPVYHDDESE